MGHDLQTLTTPTCYSDPEQTIGVDLRNYDRMLASMEKEVLTFKAFRSSRDAYDRAAEQAGLTRSEWVRIVCDAACGISPLPEQLTRVVQFEAKPIRDGKW